MKETTGRWLWVSDPKYVASHKWKVGYEGTWSCSQHTRVGDLVVLYEKGQGAMRFRWLAEIESDAEPDEDWGSICAYRVIALFDPPIPLKNVTSDKTFLNWGTYRARFQGLGRFEVPLEIWEVLARECGFIEKVSEKAPKKEKQTSKGEDDLTEDIDPEESAFEGKARKYFVTHRKRERKLRDKKVAEVKKVKGKLCCEVKNCGFEFFATYGEVGEGYIQVHHEKPLSAREVPEQTLLKELVLVCANCHVMIHRNGKCRELETLLPTKKSPKKKV